MNKSPENNADDKFLKKLFKTNTGDLRLVWIFLLIPIFLLGTLVVSRLIFILVTRQIYLADGYLKAIALEKAQTLMMTPGPQAFLCVIDTLLIVLSVFLLTKIEKRKFQWSTLGLTFKPSSLLYFLLGIFLGFIFQLITLGVGLMVGTHELQPLEFEAIFTQSNINFMIYFFVWAMFNGFWQELLFRGYLQTRMIERYKKTIGILGATIYFDLIHFIDRQLTFSWVLAMYFLFLIISLMFHQTKSLYLVAAMHGTINYFYPVIELMGLEWTSSSTDIYWLINSLIIAIILTIYLLLTKIINKRKAMKKNLSIQ